MRTSSHKILQYRSRVDSLGCSTSSLHDVRLESSTRPQLDRTTYSTERSTVEDLAAIRRAYKRRGHGDR
jgi:hypothetical protein